MESPLYISKQSNGNREVPKPLWPVKDHSDEPRSGLSKAIAECNIESMPNEMKQEERTRAGLDE